MTIVTLDLSESIVQTMNSWVEYINAYIDDINIYRDSDAEELYSHVNFDKVVNDVLGKLLLDVDFSLSFDGKDVIIDY